MLIRDRRPPDGPALAAIARLTHALDGYPKYLPDDLQSFIADPTALGAWVAEDGGEVVGHVALHARSVPEVMQALLSATGLDKDDVAVVARLLVTPAARRRGLGRSLLERATAEAEARGRRAVLDVVDEHTKAIALYDECGWVRVAQVDWSLPGGRPFHELIYVAPERAPAQGPGTNR